MLSKLINMTFNGIKSILTFVTYQNVNMHVYTTSNMIRAAHENGTPKTIEMLLNLKKGNRDANGQLSLVKIDYMATIRILCHKTQNGQ